MSQVGRISGPLLKDNLLRNGVDLSFSNTLGTDYVLYLDVSTSTLGITKDVPATDLDNIGNTLRSTNFINNTVYPVPIANFNIDDSDLNVLVGDINLNAGEAIVLSNFENDNIKISDNTISTYRSNASIELNPNGGAKLVRSAGSSAKISGVDENYCIIKLTSGEIRKVINSARATIGSVSNADHQNIKIGKAGRNRWKGRRPSVRGVAMNPVDHPHGGGEGKTSGGRSPVSPWGQSAKGLKTRNNKTTNKYIISSRKKRN